MKWSWSALAVIVAAAGAALVLAASALAFGGGSSSAQPTWTTRLDAPTWSGRLRALYPGAANDAEVFRFRVTNSGRTTEDLRSVTVSLASAAGDVETAAGAAVRGCRTGWFAVSVDARDRSLPVSLAPGATYTGRVELSMQNSHANQDACQGSAPAFTVSAQ